jgi:acyl-CoA thioester hydrolase
MTDPLSSYPVVLRQAIAWGDMDVHGHVNNIVYYRYMENARIAYYERVGKYALEAETGVGFVLAANACRFRVPLAYPGVVLVGARVSTVGDDRATMQYILVRDSDRRVAAEGEATLVAFDLRKRAKAAFPDALRRRIIELQGGLG